MTCYSSGILLIYFIKFLNKPRSQPISYRGLRAATSIFNLSFCVLFLFFLINSAYFCHFF